MSNPDIAVFYAINNNCSNLIFDKVMPVISAAGTNEFLALAALLIMIFLAREKKIAGVVMLAGLTLSYYSTGMLKAMIARPRPFVALEGVNRLVSRDGFSFPSGHSTCAFMAAFVLTSFFGRKHLFFSAAALVAFSRVYVGVHYPSDVISGAALGIGLGYFLVSIVGYAKKDMDSVMFSHEK